MTSAAEEIPVAESAASAISTGKHNHAPKAIPFIKAEEKPSARLQTAPDWQLQVDLGKQLHIATTSLWPDMIITPEVTKHLIMLELTVPPWEERRIEEANERKHTKYEELVEECRGWRMFYEPTEVGYRGSAGRSLCEALGHLGGLIRGLLMSRGCLL